MVLAAFILLVLVVLFNALPLAFFGMLFLGNLGFHLSFGTSLLGALAVKFTHHSIFSPAGKK